VSGGWLYSRSRGKSKRVRLFAGAPSGTSSRFLEMHDAVRPIGT